MENNNGLQVFSNGQFHVRSLNEADGTICMKGGEINHDR